MGANNRFMVKVASSEGVSICCPEGGRISFFNSPYPAHKVYTAIDIYPSSGFGSTAPSPVSGKIREIRKVACPEKSSFKSTNYDYAILIQSLENPAYWIKILHLEPLVKAGDIVRVGDDLGRLIRSGFFDYWTDPHMHVEVRKPEDPIRARGGLKLRRELVDLTRNCSSEIGEIRGVIIELKTEYALMLPNGNLRHGIPIEICGKKGLIDGGIPHYGFFGVHTERGDTALQNAPVKLCGVNIGVVERTFSDACVVRCSDRIFKVKNIPVRLSFYLYLSRPLVKIILGEHGRPELKKFEEVSITISGQ